MRVKKSEEGERKNKLEFQGFNPQIEATNVIIYHHHSLWLDKRVKN